MATTYKRILRSLLILRTENGVETWVPEMDVPPGATILPADPSPPSYTQARQLDPQHLRTVDASVTQIFRWPIPINTAYRARLTIWATTDDLSNVRVIEAIFVVGRASGNVVLIQTRLSPANATLILDHSLGPVAGIWAIPVVSVDNTAPGGAQRRDIVITVTGQAATGINWLLTGSFETFVPAGNA